MEKKNILIISLSHLSSDARVLRQIVLLSRYFNVDTLGLSSSKLKEVGFYKIKDTSRRFSSPKDIFLKPLKILMLMSGNFEKYLEIRFVVEPRFFDDLKRKRYDLIVVNDLIALPFAFKIRGKAKIYFDAHEYYPKQFEDVLTWRLLFAKHMDNLCRIYLRQVDAMSTICESRAREYERNYGVKPVVITNAAPYKNLNPSQVSEPVKLVHHGGATPSRKIELMIEMMKYLDSRFVFDLYLVPTNKRYFEKLRKLGRKFPRVKIMQAIPYDKLIENLNKYDIGVYILPPVNFNSLYTLPNKLFEFIQARLCIAIAPTPEMAEIVRKYDLGVVADDFSPYSLAKKINSLSHDDIMHYKRQSHKWAGKLSAEEEDKKILRIVRELIG